MCSFQKIRKATAWRGLVSKLGSLLLLFQRSPLVQMLFPEAKLLAGAGLGEATKWTVTAIVGLGAYDTVAGATEITQVFPDSGASEVSATTGKFLNFLFQITGTPSSEEVSWSVDGLPPGLTNSDTSPVSSHVINGIPTELGTTTVTVTAWRFPNQTGDSFSKEFLIIVEPPIIATQPASVAIANNTSTTLSVVANANGSSLTYKWYRGTSGNTAQPIAGNNAPSYTTTTHSTSNTPADYWVRVTRDDGSQDSNTATVTIIAAPVVTSQPVSTSILNGGTASLSFGVSGSGTTLQWYQGNSGDTANPVSGETSSYFTTPPLTSTTSYWARATNAGGNTDSNTATVTVNSTTPNGAGPFKIGESVRIDLDPLANAGEALKLVGKLPKGLKLNLKTGEITGTVSGLEGTYPIKFNILQGRTLLRTIDFPIVISGTLFFAGNYEAILESNAAIPAGVFKLLFKKGNAWSATLESPGAKARKASGKVVLVPGTTAGSLTATFSASGSAPAVTLNTTLDLESPIFSGTYNGGTVRGFRLARTDELPPASTTLSLVFEAGVHDGITAPAGIGWANGAIGPSGTATFSGMLGDGTAVELPINLSATGQAILWSQPYANTGSYFGGIVTLPDLGQTPADNPPLADKVGWFKAADTKSLSYPVGFPTMEVAVGSSTWAVPTTPQALGASLGWANNDSPVVEIDGAGLSNAAPQLGTPTLPTGFTLDASFNLTSQVSPSVVPWTGKSNAANGTFTGSFMLPATFVPEGIAGPAAASGVLLQADPWGNVTGCGLIKVPIAGAKGSFRTAAIILKQ